MNNSTQLHATIHRICDAVHFATDSNDVGQWHFNNSPVVSESGYDHGYATQKEKNSEHPITLALRDRLYQHCFTQSFAYESSAEVNDSAQKYATESDDDMTALLSSANQGQTVWDTGWSIESISTDGGYVVSKNDVKRLVYAGDIVSNEATSQAIGVGSTVAVCRPRESTYWQPGFYFAFGQTGQDEFERCEKIRIYWNVDAEGAPNLVSAITGEFNRYQIPFRFKCTNLRSLSPRIDTAVLYVPITNFRLSINLCLQIHRTLHAWIGKSVPLFTHELAPGLSFAQNPDSETSFGMERCLRLARAIINSQVQDCSKPKIEHVVQQLKADGLDLDKPHLLSGYPDLFSDQLTEIDYEHAS